MLNQEIFACPRQIFISNISGYYLIITIWSSTEYISWSNKLISLSKPSKIRQKISQKKKSIIIKWCTQLCKRNNLLPDVFTLNNIPLHIFARHRVVAVFILFTSTVLNLNFLHTLFPNMRWYGICSTELSHLHKRAVSCAKTWTEKAYK